MFNYKGYFLQILLTMITNELTGYNFKAVLNYEFRYNETKEKIKIKKISQSDALI